MTKEEYQKRFAYWLSRILIERNMSKLELSRRTGISHTAICMYCHEKRMPTAYNLMKIAEALKCSYTILGVPNPIP